MDLASKTIPAVDKDGALRGLDGLGVLESLPRDLRERVALDEVSLLHGTEAVLLAVAAVPHPVPEKVGTVHDDQGVAVPAVSGGIVVGQVEGAVAVRQRDTSKVPEDEHEAPFLVVHVPSRDDELLALGAGIGIEVVSHDEEHDLARNVAVLLILTCSRTETENQKEVPGHANLEEHLEIKDAKHARVQLSTHEEVVDGVASHAVLLASPQSREISDEADNEAAADGNRQQRAKLVEGRVEGPDAGEVQGTKNSESSVQAGIGVAEVIELLATGVGKRLALAPDTGKKTVASTLEDEVAPVPKPCL